MKRKMSVSTQIGGRARACRGGPHAGRGAARGQAGLRVDNDNNDNNTNSCNNNDNNDNNDNDDNNTTNDDHNHNNDNET